MRPMRPMLFAYAQYRLESWDLWDSEEYWTYGTYVTYGTYRRQIDNVMAREHAFGFCRSGVGAGHFRTSLRSCCPAWVMMSPVSGVCRLPRQWVGS